MAYLSKNLERLTGSDGSPLAGGKLRVYQANTTNLANLFTAANLTGAGANPIVADAAGILPMRFLAAGNYDIAVLTPGGVVLDAWDDVPSIGSDEADFSRDFGNSRFQVRGSGGTVYVEAGDADPDNAGGTGVLGGWEGTQADSWTVNAALFNVLNGRIKENSKKILGVVSTEATAFSAAATVDIPLTNDPTGVIAWDIDVWDFVMSATANLYGRLSYDGGGTYKAGASDYFGHYFSAAAAGESTTADLTLAQMDFVSNMKGTTARPGVVQIRVITVDSGTVATRVVSRAQGLTHSTVLELALGNWFAEGGYGRATHLRLLGASGTITGKYRVTPLRGFGEV